MNSVQRGNGFAKLNAVKTTTRNSTTAPLTTPPANPGAMQSEPLTAGSYAAGLIRHFARTRRFWLAYQQVTLQDKATAQMLEFADQLQSKTATAYQLFNAKATNHAK
jgi:hypothetical protein